MARLLIIEDNDALRDILVRSFYETHEVLEADNGFTGIEIARTFLPDLVICDIAMHGMDGYSVLTQIRSEEATSEVPFIFLTAHGEREWMRRGMDMGADDFMTKPFDLSDLQNAVEAHLRKKAMREMLLNKKVDALRDNILAALPHELRTAIMVIEGYTHLLMNDVPDIDGEQMEMLTALVDGTARLHRLSEKYLWYSRSQFLKPNQVLNCPTNRAEVIIHETAVATAYRFSRVNDLQVETMPSTVSIGEEVLQRVVEELMENACKFSLPGTPILIRMQARERHIRITIQDQGRGMTEQQIAQISAFNQFEREQYEQQGVGLGLVIAKRFAEAHGGKLTLQSVPNEGTKARLYLQYASSDSSLMQVSRKKA
ncbi:MAG: hybrid sensor histidine kinase/response regulator [Chitinophagaceae bacterium]|nr:hybrid sensor histidine kinase/response regulator [Anaerolineae bacterium]